MDYGEKIRLLRKKKKLSAEKLGKLVGFSQSMISKLENGERNIDIYVLEKICSALGLTLAEFFANQTPEYPPEVHQILEKVQQLPPDRLKVLSDVLDTWVKNDLKED